MIQLQHRHLALPLCTVAQATPTAAADDAADLAKATQNCATLLPKTKSQPYNFTLSEENTYAKAINEKAQTYSGVSKLGASIQNSVYQPNIGAALKRDGRG
jgi:hypothetical protein